MLSVVIITLNEERNIGRCLDSLSGLADEVVVVDSLSTDATRSICERHGARFIEQPFLGYIEQKNFALGCARHGHVLSLDADEALSPELAASIRREKELGFPSVGYTMNRLSRFNDRWIRHGSWYPDRKLRLIRSGQAVWGGMNPHDRLSITTGEGTRQLKGDLLHYPYYSLEEFVAQWNRFSTIAARAMHERGAKAHWWNLVWNPFVAFIKGYFIKGGFLDGMTGYVLARQSASNTFLKYAKLIQLGRS